jgi:hypothetical protein
LAGQEPAHSPSLASTADLYGPARNLQTYARLLGCAEGCLQGGISVIIDATFLKGEDRRQFEGLADRLGASFIIISCLAEPEEMARRILRRTTNQAEPSDANASVLEQQLQSFMPLQAEELRHVIRVNTMQPNAERAALATLQARQVNTAQKIAWPLRRNEGISAKTTPS